MPAKICKMAADRGGRGAKVPPEESIDLEFFALNPRQGPFSVFEHINFTRG